MAWFNTEAGSWKLCQLHSRELWTTRYRARILGRRGTRIVAAVAAAVLLLSPRAAVAQASAYVPLDDIAYAYVDALMARASLRELLVLQRPYTTRAIRAALDSARARDFGPAIGSYLDALSDAMRKYEVRPADMDTVATRTFRARFTGDAYATAQSSGRRELMVADSASDVKPGVSLRMVLAGGPVVGAVRVLLDNRLNVDPEFAGRKDRKVAARNEDGYVSGQWKYGELSFGRVGRNWGPPALYGLMLGNYAYTYDHLYGRIGTDKVNWSTVVTRLEDSVPPSGPAIERYFSIHRIAIRVKNWELAGSESYLYAGPGRSFEPSLVNPLNIYGLSWRNERQEGNLGLGLETALRTDRIGNFSGQIFIDDLQLDRSCDPACKQPSSYAFSLSADGLPLGGDQRWFASYARVSNLAYRNKNPSEHYTSFAISLGQSGSDYDEFRAGVDLALVPRAPLKVYVAHRRQGEGNYNIPYPQPVDYATTPGIFDGVVMGVTRLGVSGVGRFGDIELGGDLGFNHNTNDGHQSGASRTSFEGRLKVAIEPRWSIAF